MFEQSVIPRSPKGKRVWTTCVGVTGQVLLVTGMVVAPMLWPQAMPPATFVMLVPHAPAGRPKGNPEVKHQASIATTRPIRKYIGLVQPSQVPTIITIVTDPPAAANYTNGEQLACAGCVPGGPEWGARDGVQWSTGGDGPDRTQEVKVHPVEPIKPVTVAVPRVKQGGLVRPPRLTRQVDPPYPPIAKVAHIEGIVKLSGVIAVDGHISELTVESGNPLLVPAALGAVRQWLYEPTLLNGVPVEVMTTIVVTFTLNR
jgi:protein TonB